MSTSSLSVTLSKTHADHAVDQRCLASNVMGLTVILQNNFHDPALGQQPAGMLLH